jgi:hypothetical protein
MMKRLLSIALMGLISASLLGCEARGRIGDPDGTTAGTRDVEYRKTETVRETDGDVRTRTEIRRSD